jgi:AraC-like DNA-binding protein
MVEMGWRRAENLSGVEVVDSRFGKEVLEPAVLDAYLIALYAEGESEIWRPDGVEVVGAGSLLVSMPGQVVRILRRRTEQTRLRALLVSPAAMGSALGDGVLALPPQPTHGLRDAEVVARAEQLSAALDAGAEPMAVQSAFTELVARVFGPVEQGPRILGPALRRVRDLLHAEVGRNLTLDELAAVAGISKFHLVRGFAAAFGVPPHRYHLQVRLERARTFLREGWAIGDVAVGLAFADQSHLTRHFSRTFGVSPARYRARVRAP